MKTLFVLTMSVAMITAKERPNIVLIMADDVGLGDISHHVRTQLKKEPVVETPALDALAREGLWFTDGHSATSLCSPTRYCVMSGNNNYRSNAPWGVWGTFRETAFVRGEVTLGSVVRDAGYRTGFVGKWHLGGEFRDLKSGRAYRGTDQGDISDAVDLTRFVGSGPKEFGFDYDYTQPCGIQGPIYLHFENEVWAPLSESSKLIHLNERTAINPKDLSSKGAGMGDSAWDARQVGQNLSSKAVGFIEGHAGKAPFFLYYCTPTVHVPHCPPDQFDGKEIKGATPSLHLDMLLDLDQQVRRIVDCLKATGEYDNTLIVFTSDNGGLQVDKETAASGHRSSGGWAGSKNSPLEGGHRVPFFAVWPGHIEPGVTDELAVNLDMLATFAALVGTEVPRDQAQDSNNLLPLLLGKGDFQQRDFLVQQAGSQKEIMYRKMPWKLIIQSDAKLSKFEPKALYDLEKNPHEKWNQNLLGNPEFKPIVERMLREYLEILRSRQRTAPGIQ